MALLCAYATTFIPVAADEVYAYLLRFEQFPIYDEKVAATRVLGIDSQGRTELEITGRFAFLPYVANMRATIDPGKGYTAEMVAGAFFRAKSQFWVHGMDGGCEVGHLEEYHLGLGWISRALAELWRPYVQAAVEREVLTLKQLMHDGHHRQSLALTHAVSPV